MKRDMSDWMQADADGYQPIPHKNGKIKWFIMSHEEDGAHYVGEYDMTDWNTTWDKVWAKAQEMADRYMTTHEWILIRGDHLIDIMFNVANCLHSAGEFDKWWLPKDYYEENEDGL